jgi:hypothetical protein
MSDCRDLVVFEPGHGFPYASDEELAVMLAECNFNLGRVAKILGIKRRILYEKVTATPELMLDKKDFDEELVDDAEEQLMESARGGKPNAIMKILESKGRDRGYGKQENLGSTITIEVRRLAN